MAGRRARKALLVGGVLVLVLVLASLLPPSITARLGPLGGALDTVREHTTGHLTAACKPPPDPILLPMGDHYLPKQDYHWFDGRTTITTPDGKQLYILVQPAPQKQLEILIKCDGTEERIHIPRTHYYENHGKITVYSRTLNKRITIIPTPYPLPGGTIHLKLNLTGVDIVEYTNWTNGTIMATPILYYSTGLPGNTTITLPTGQLFKVKASVSLSHLTVHLLMNRTPADGFKPDLIRYKFLPPYVLDVKVYAAGKPINESDLYIAWKDAPKEFGTPAFHLVVEHIDKNGPKADPLIILPGENWTVEITLLDSEGKQTTFVITVPYPEYAWELAIPAKKFGRMTTEEWEELAQEWAEELSKIVGYQVVNPITG